MNPVGVYCVVLLDKALTLHFQRIRRRGEEKGTLRWTCLPSKGESIEPKISSAGLTGC